MAIYRWLKKRRGRAKILASTVVTLSSGLPCKLVFVRDRTKSDWLAILATDIDLPDEQIVRIYGKRWDIEVFFKMIKQHLRLAKEIQSRDFDTLIGHTSIVFMRYMFLAYHCRLSTDHRSFGDLFHACCDEIRDISFLEALMRILTLAADRMRSIGWFCQKTFAAFFYVAMEVTINTLGVVKNSAISFSMNPESLVIRIATCGRLSTIVRYLFFSFRSLQVFIKRLDHVETDILQASSSVELYL